MNIIKFIIFIILGIIIFFILNKGDGFNIGVPWIVINDETDINVYKLDGSVFTCDFVDEPAWSRNPYVPIDLEGKCFKNFNDALTPDPDDVIYHVIPSIVEDYYRLNLEKCYGPHTKIRGNLPQTDPAESWKNKTQENSETKPLIPRKNLDLESWHRLDTRNTPPYDIDHAISYSCDTEKTQSKDPQQLVCKSRKKFVLQSHGVVYVNEWNRHYKTSVPQLFQLMLYKTENGDCIQSNLYGQLTTINSILKKNSEITSNNEIIDLRIFNKFLRPHHPITFAELREKQMPNNKAYLATLELQKTKENRPMEELVYSEFSHLNSGALYLAGDVSSGLEMLAHKIPSARYFEYDDTGETIGCFLTKALTYENAELIVSLAYFFLNPFMNEISILYSSDLENFNRSNLEGIRPELLNTPQILDESIAANLIPEMVPGSLYEDGTHFRDFTITHVMDDYDDRNKPEYGISFNSARSDKWTERLGCASSRGQPEWPCSLGIAQQMEYYSTAEQIDGYNPVGGMRRSTFVDGGKTEDVLPNTRRPVYFYKYRIGSAAVDPSSETIQALHAQVKRLLISCCVTVDPNLLTPEFRARDSMERLFPNNATPRRFPLLYFDIYTKDGFEHPAWFEGNFSLDETDPTHNDKLGQYTSDDLRNLVKDIIDQIHVGSTIDPEQRVNGFGYYQLFKKKMMIEKGFNDQMCREKLTSMFGMTSQGGVTVLLAPEVFIRQPDKFITRNRFLWARVLQNVWGNYGYQYLSEATTSGYNAYQYSADIPIIFAKLFKTEYGESADVHILCCIPEEDTSVRSIQTNAYWGCTDTPGYSEYTGPTTPQNTCEWYKTNSIAKCNTHGHRGANDNCCICKMVKNRSENADPDLRPNVGPDCKVKECKQILQDVNGNPNVESMNNGILPSEMTITLSNWQKDNLWTGEAEGRTNQTPSDRKDRKMEHTETAYRYISDQTDDEYGAVQLITEDGNLEGVLRETSPITVFCNHTSKIGNIVEGVDDDGNPYSYVPGTLYDAGIIAGETRCNSRDINNPNSDRAVYTGDLECPGNLCSASISIYDDYYPLPSEEGIPPVTGGGMELMKD